MSFSYDPTIVTDIDRMRYALGDITAPGNDPDETYTAQLTAMGGSWRRAAAAIARSFAARGIGRPTQMSDDGTAMSWMSDRSGAWLRLAAQLEAEAAAEEATQDGALYVQAPSRLDLSQPDGEYSMGLRGWRR